MKKISFSSIIKLTIILVLITSITFVRQNERMTFIRSNDSINKKEILDQQKEFENNFSLTDISFNATFYEELAYYWAPVWYQDSDSENYAADYITNFNFDNNWVGYDNWENLDSHSLFAYIYYSVVETETHWFLGYYDFHPRDWSFPVHENDMEGAMVIIQKGNTTWGDFLCLLTEAHNQIHQYKDYQSEPSNSVTNDYDVIEGDVEFQLVDGFNSTLPFDNHTNPIVYVESKGHGVYGAERWENTNFPDNDGLVYLPRGLKDKPENGNDRDVSYKLLSINDIWNKRFGPYGAGKTFGSFSAFDGDNGLTQDSAKAPWGWEDPNDGNTFAGEIFYNPADLLDIHLNLPGNYSKNYLYNPYAVEIKLTDFKVIWDKDANDPDLADGYLDLYTFDGEGISRKVLSRIGGTQFNWLKSNIGLSWINLTEEITRPFYGIYYPNKPFFGIQSWDYDSSDEDDLLMNLNQIFWYGPYNTPNYSDHSVIPILEGSNHFDWVGSKLNLTINENSEKDFNHYILPPKILSPNGGESFQIGLIEINWTAAYDSYSHDILYDLFYSPDFGLTWKTIVVGFSSTSTDTVKYIWNSSMVVDKYNDKPGDYYLIIIKAECLNGSDSLIVFDTSDDYFSMVFEYTNGVALEFPIIISIIIFDFLIISIVSKKYSSHKANNSLQKLFFLDIRKDF
ncbi:MAG: hypothetical protein ACFFDW_09535 [Candidatus Thorarchaeota archaeon]